MFIKILLFVSALFFITTESKNTSITHIPFYIPTQGDIKKEAVKDSGYHALKSGLLSIRTILYPELVASTPKELFEEELSLWQAHIHTYRKYHNIPLDDPLTKQDLKNLIALEQSKKQTSLVPDLHKIAVVFVTEHQVLELSSHKKIETLIYNLKDPVHTLVALVLVQYSDNWLACVINKYHNTIQYFIADPAGYTKSNKPFIKEVLRFLGYSKTPFYHTQAHKTSSLGHLFQESQVTRENFVGQLPQAIEDIITVLNKPHLYKTMGINYTPALMLLYGPSGTGKTTLAKLIAHETKRPYIEVIGSSLLNKYYGEGVKYLKSIFENARLLHKPVIIFIDEIDAILATTDKENQRTDLLQAFNHELDKHDPFIFCIGATNRYHLIDSTTKTRCKQYCIEIPLPNYYARENILRYYLEKLSIQNNKLLSVLVERTDTLSCRELEHIIYQSIIIAQRHKSEHVEESHVYQALEEILYNVHQEQKEVHKHEQPWIDIKYLFKHTLTALTAHIAIELCKKLYQLLPS